jgi:hypothetical protein
METEQQRTAPELVQVAMEMTLLAAVLVRAAAAAVATLLALMPVRQAAELVERDARYSSLMGRQLSRLAAVAVARLARLALPELAALVAVELVRLEMAARMVPQELLILAAAVAELLAAERELAALAALALST